MNRTIISVFSQSLHHCNFYQL